MRNEQPQTAARELGFNPNLSDFLHHDIATSPRWNRPVKDDALATTDRNGRSPRVRMIM